MNDSTALALMTTEELLALPEDPEVERELIRGQLIERPMTRRNPKHSAVTVKVVYSLEHWLNSRPKPRGRVLAGEAGFRLRRDPDTTVGIDVAYIAAELDRATPPSARLVDGIPILAVEILSPSDRQEDITAKVEEYLAVDAPLVWLIDPVLRTVTVHRPDAPPQMFAVGHELAGDPHLPGLRVAVADLFE